MTDDWHDCPVCARAEFLYVYADDGWRDSIGGVCPPEEERRLQQELVSAREAHERGEHGR